MARSAGTLDLGFHASACTRLRVNPPQIPSSILDARANYGRSSADSAVPVSSTQSDTAASVASTAMRRSRMN